MSSTPVRRDQFKIRSASGRPAQGKQDPGQLGNVLPNGEDYRLHEMQAMMELLWAEYVDANPRLFRAVVSPMRYFCGEAQQSTNSPYRRSARLHGKPDPVPTGPQGGMARPSG